MIIAVAVLEQAIEKLPIEPDTETSSTVTMMLYVMTSVIVQTSAKNVDIDTMENFHQKPMLLWKL